jgi:hypothetical protein
MIIDLYTYKAEDKLFQQQQQQQLYDQQQRHASSLVIKELINAGAITSKTVIEIAYPTRPHNYTWCKYCGKIIRFQLFETYRIVHPKSFLNFYWHKETIRKQWRAFDVDLGKDYDNGIDTDQSWEPHIHTQIKNKKQLTNGVAA